MKSDHLLEVVSRRKKKVIRSSLELGSFTTLTLYMSRQIHLCSEQNNTIVLTCSASAEVEVPKVGFFLFFVFHKMVLRLQRSLLVALIGLHDTIP